MENNIQNPDNKLRNDNNQSKFISLQRGDVIFVILAFIAVASLSLFGIFSGFALGYLIASTLINVLYIIYLFKRGRGKLFPCACGLLSIALGTIFISTTNGSVRFFGFIIGILLSFVCFDGLANGTAKGNRKTLGILYSAASTLGNLGRTFNALFSGRNGNKKLVGKAIIGLLCALPVLVVVLPLLISSDDAFRGMMNDIFSNTFSITMKIIFGVSICPFFISYGFSLKSGKIAKIKNSRFSGIENTYLIAFLSAIGVCYLLYLFSQLAYFFSAFRGFLPNGTITYSQYARKGFFEMCVIAVINLLLIFGALLLAKKKKGKVCHAIKALTTFISVFTLIIIVTAISKMILYINAYGMTALRLTTSSFMLFLAIVFISVMLRIYISKINIIKTGLIAAGCILLLLGTVNVNYVCAGYNYEAYQNKKLNTIDVEALYQLGDEGIPYIVKLASSNDVIVSSEAQTHLREAYLYDYFDNMENAVSFTVDELKENKKTKGVECYMIPKHRAYHSLYEYIEDNPWFALSCQTYSEDSGQNY